MDRRRRQRSEAGETADQRLDRLIEMERKSQIHPPAVPEVRRLNVDEGGALASGSDPRQGDRRGEDGDEAVQGPATSLQLGADGPTPDGMLAPLFQDLGPEGTSGVLYRRLDEDDITRLAVEAEPGPRGSPGAAGAGLQPAQDLPNDAGRGQSFENRDGSTLLEAAGGPFGQDRSGTGGLVVSPGVNAFWSAGVRRAAALEQVADVERPLALPPLAGPPVSFGPGQALGVHHGGSGLLQPGVGPEQAPSHLVAAGMSPVQAPLVGAGPEQASMRMVAAGVSPGQAPPSGAGLVQAHGAGEPQGGPEQARGGMRGAGPVQALTNGALSQPSPEKSVEELRPRIMREAEESFIREAKKLKGEEIEGEIRSYHTASSGPDAAARLVPPMPALQGAATATSLAMQSAGHLMPSHPAGHDGLQRGAQIAGQGHGVMWSQPVSPTAVNSPGLLDGQSPGLHGGAWASHGHLQAAGLYGGVGSTLNSHGHATGLHGGGRIPSSWNPTGPMASLGGGGMDSNVAAGTTGAAPLVMPPGLGWWSGSTSRQHDPDGAAAEL